MTIVLDHFVLEVQDPFASLVFYRKALGLRPVREAAYRQGKAPFPSMRLNAGTIIDLFPPGRWIGKQATNPAHFCVTFSAREFQKLEVRLQRHDIAIEDRDDHNYGARGFATAIYFRDPDGNRVEARTYRKK